MQKGLKVTDGVIFKQNSENLTLEEFIQLIESVEKGW
jgi:hypothetical protein